MKFNTAISAFMEFLNFVEEKQVSIKTIEVLLKLLYPFAPHIGEELWKIIGKENMVHEEAWPTYDEELTKKDSMELVIQVNGKVRDKIEINANLSKDEIEKIALNSENVQKWINNKELRKVIFIPPKLINIVI